MCCDCDLAIVVMKIGLFSKRLLTVAYGNIDNFIELLKPIDDQRYEPAIRPTRVDTLKLNQYTHCNKSIRLFRDPLTDACDFGLLVALVEAR
jgi:hypothetical protein